jgi:hypothetical protein
MTLSARQLEAQCKHRMKSGQKWDDVRKFLVSEGMTDSSAEAMLKKTLEDLRSQAGMTLGAGGALAIIGIVASIAVTQVSNGMVQLFWWGPVLIGIPVAVVGLAKLLKLRRR